MVPLEQELSTILETTRKFDPFGSTSWTLVTGAQAGSAEAFNGLAETDREPFRTGAMARQATGGND